MGLPCCFALLADVPSPLPRRTRRGRLFGAFDGPCTRRRRPSLYPARSASATVVSRPARRSLLLRPVCSPDHPSMIRLASEASADSLPPRLFRLLPGGTINLPSGTFTRRRTTPFHGALDVTFSPSEWSRDVARWRDSLRFHVPLIEPDVRVSRIRLSEKVHAFACGRRLESHFSWSRPNFRSSQGLQYQHGLTITPLCLARHHLRNRYRVCELITR